MSGNLLYSSSEISCSSPFTSTNLYTNFTHFRVHLLTQTHLCFLQIHFLVQKFLYWMQNRFQTLYKTHRRPLQTVLKKHKRFKCLTYLPYTNFVTQIFLQTFTRLQIGTYFTQTLLRCVWLLGSDDSKHCYRTLIICSRK